MSKLIALETSPVGKITPPKFELPTSGELSPTDIVSIILGWLVWIAGAVALGFLIYGGILFITAGGDAEKVTKARNTILYSIVGIIVVVAAYLLVNWASGAVG